MTLWHPGKPRTDEGADSETCPSCGARSPIGVEIRGVYDGVLFWQCSGCGTAYHRWPEESWHWRKAEPYVAVAEGWRGTR